MTGAVLEIVQHPENRFVVAKERRGGGEVGKG